MRRFGFWLSLAVPAFAVVGMLWGTEVPLGIPGEWEWLRKSLDGPLWGTWIPPILVGGTYAGCVALGARRIERASWLETGAWLVGLVLAAFGWLWAVQESAADGYQLSKSAWVLYYSSSSGYYTEARSDRQSTEDFLRTYEQKMSQGDVLHIGTHPPGLILFFRGLIALCRESPGVTAALVASEPDSVRASMEQLEPLARTTELPLFRADRAVLWLAMLLAQGLAALTVWPLYGLARQTVSPRSAWLAAAFWPTVPAVAVFLPKSDAVFPFFAALIVWLFWKAAQQRSVLLSFLGGLVLCLSLTLSLAFLPIAWFAALLVIWEIWFRARHDPRGELLARESRVRAQFMGLGFVVLGGLLGLALPCVALASQAGINMPAVWTWNLRNHAGFYEQFTRTYWKWFLVNPLEFAVAAGTPLVALAGWGLLRQIRSGGFGAAGVAIAFLGTWGVLWLSGKNMGEAARLWCFLTPFVACLAAPVFETPDPAAGNGTPDLSGSWDWAVALVILLVNDVALVTRVVGFHY